MKEKIYIYYEEGQQKLYYNIKTKKIVDKLPEQSDTVKIKQYMLHKGYEPTKAGIERYYQDFKKWCDELTESKTVKMQYRYDKYYSDFNAIKSMYHYMAGKNAKQYYQKLENRQLSREELYFVEDCNNSGHVYLDESRKDQFIKGYGYDYSGFYPWLMSKKILKIPLKEGTYKTLENVNEIDLNLPGIYRVKITCSNPNIKKIFQFSKKSTYTNTSIHFMKYLHVNYPTLFKLDDVNFEMVNDGKPNSLIYDKFVTGDVLFGEWYDKIAKLKEEYPKNGLVKLLSSMLWGRLSRAKYNYLTEEESDDMDPDELKRLHTGNIITKRDGTVYHKVIENLPRFALLKPFLTSLARKIIAEAILKLDPELKSLVRCYTDGIILDKPCKIRNTVNFKLLKVEKKTTGILYFVSASKYYNETTNKFHDKWRKEEKQKITSY